MALTEENAKNLNEEDIIDIDLSPIKKKRYRINGDNNKILELNVSDTGILERITKIEPQLNKLGEEASNFTDDELEDNSKEGLEAFTKKLAEINEKMCKLIDDLFKAPVSAVCADDGYMYDVFDGQYRFEYVINTVIELYEKNISAEYKKLHKRMEKHTSKYIRK